VTNGIQDVALAFEKGKAGVMSRLTRRLEEGIFNKIMVQETFIAGATMGLIAFGVWYRCTLTVVFRKFTVYGHF